MTSSGMDLTSFSRSLSSILITSFIYVMGKFWENKKRLTKIMRIFKKITKRYNNGIIEVIMIRKGIFRRRTLYRIKIKRGGKHEQKNS